MSETVGAPVFSLVMATVGRLAALERFMESLRRQIAPSFELVVVDQSPESGIDETLAPYLGELAVVRTRSPRGASRARNAGLEKIRGEIVTFPDDDCWFPEGLLASVAERFEEHPEWDGIVGRPIDECGSSTHARWDAEPGPVTVYNAWRRGITPTMFLRRRVVDAVGRFDETIGPGAATGLGGSDDTDYLIRAIRMGFSIHYDPWLVVYHPDPPIEGDPGAAARAYSYGRSMTAVLRKHRYPAWYVAYACARPLGGAALALSRRRRERARFHWSAFSGRVHQAIKRPSP